MDVSVSSARLENATMQTYSAWRGLRAERRELRKNEKDTTVTHTGAPSRSSWRCSAHIQLARLHGELASRTDHGD